MHGDYEKAVLRWVKDIRLGIFDSDAYLEAYPERRELMRKLDAKRRIKQRSFGRTIDWDTAEVLESVCKKLGNRPYPRSIMLDSGAFTAWNKGEKTTVEDVKRKYSKFIELADGLFDEIWAINLDVIPGERGRDPTPQELEEAVRVSDLNYEILTKEFGNIILPVFHQGESPQRLVECAAQVDGRHNYICVSPRNDCAESIRINWARDVHSMLADKYPHVRTHGLATTGNRMVRNVPWYSGDSAAWVQHGGFGMVTIFHDEKNSFGRKKDPHYMNYFVTFENVQFDLAAAVRTKDGSLVTGIELGLAGKKIHECAETYLSVGVEPDRLPLVGGRMMNDGKYFSTLSNEHQAYIRQRVEALGFPFEACRWDSRIRNLVCMAEIGTFAEWAKSSTKEPAQQYLFGGF
jgi:hypothetical protein